jgi:septum formation protein
VKVTLGSGSPQRSEILRKLGVDFEVVVPGVEELTGGDPEDEVVENARRKAAAVERGGVVIACDTDVVLDGKALGKPADEAEAREYLDRMSGRAHTVMSGLVVLADGEERSGLERTTVVFKDLSEAEKERYVAFGEWRSARPWSSGSRGASPTWSACRSACWSSWSPSCSPERGAGRLCASGMMRLHFPVNLPPWASSAT